ncbi:hypothetical protein GCM10022279_02010 [Comamonas faecalis]|uniref:DUF2782 domain-containing protein n=1 Tax=Comamonas faecalis TaxID=1387849 RepID=A0ABP7QG36_9BURK
MRTALLSALLALASAPLLAQTTPAAPAPAQAATVPAAAADEAQQGRRNQRIERIVVEDAGSRIDELRVGGQTEQITVQPKQQGMPAYEVRSQEGARARPANQSAPGTMTAPRVWNLGHF